MGVMLYHLFIFKEVKITIFSTAVYMKISQAISISWQQF